jgi:polar amino acid transport system substrate-binding protein
MDYEENGEWVGLDADLSKAFAEKLGVDIEFVVIEWDNKIMELDNKSIDMVWNGMTPTDEVKKGMEVSNPYCTNGQILVMAKDKIGQYQTEESLKELSFAVEAGSMGQGVAERLECDFTAVQTQADAVMEVAAGTSEAAIVDVLIAAALVGEGTSYEDLAYGLILNEEQDVVGFRKGSDLAAELNQFLKDIYADGTMLEVAEKYSLKDFMIEQK